MISDDDKNNIRKLYLNDLHSTRTLVAMGYKRSDVDKSLKGLKRSQSEGQRASIVHHPYKESTREIMRAHRIRYLLENPSKRDGFSLVNARNKMTRGEKIFADLVIKNNLCTKYDVVNEYSFHTYKFDFAFLNIKLDVEIDGPMHFINGKRVERDFKRDAFVKSNGWEFYRIVDKDLISKPNETFELFMKDLENRQFNKRLYDICEIMSNVKIKIMRKKEIKCKNKKLKTHKLLKLHKTASSIKEKKMIESAIHREERKKKINEIRNKIISSNINFTKIGWVSQVSKIIKITPQRVNNWMKKFAPDILKNSFNRKTQAERLVLIENKKIKLNQKRQLIEKEKDAIRKMIFESNIDFSKSNWPRELKQIIDIGSYTAAVWVRNNMPEFYKNKCYKRTLNKL